jgi:hypothetical protein
MINLSKKNANRDYGKIISWRCSVCSFCTWIQAMVTRLRSYIYIHIHIWYIYIFIYLFIYMICIYDMYIYIYKYMICMYIYIHMCVYLYVHIEYICIDHIYIHIHATSRCCSREKCRFPLPCFIIRRYISAVVCVGSFSVGSLARTAWDRDWLQDLSWPSTPLLWLLKIGLIY